MPITKAAQKALRQNKRKREKNLAWKKKLKQLTKELQDLISQGKTNEAKNLLPQVYKVIDKSAKTGIIKKGAAGRKKSNLSKRIKGKAQ